ncbi:MAG TPA: ferritin family protein [Thermoanaerobaculales bacterium]|nr:ferritin family protein [Thermoanaerobaculales bacterium]HPA79524.1 ferritin family protein [Thermoanaerobaculales bacterium]HQL30436.1 ferritin family protein [Thermoanaerobaculales bacterium]
MTQAKEQIREILRKAYQIEVDGHTFYSMAAERADKPAVQELFAKLARDEVQHKAYLKTVMGSFEDKGVEAFHLHLKDPNLKAFTATIFTDRFREQASGTDFEIGVLSIGMTLENNAIAYFSGAARSATEQEVRSFYEFLADWERQHLDALQALYGGVRQEFWESSGFSPF